MYPIKKPKLVEDYLNEVDYSYLNSYVPSLFALEFVNFIKLVNADIGLENKTPVVHLRMIDTFVNDAQLDTINMCHRGIAKSTLKEYLILYIAVFNELPNLGHVPYALYVSDSIDNGVKKMRKSLEFRIENSSFLQKHIPSVKFTDIRWEFTNIDGKKFVVSGFGAKTGIRGTRELNSRPVLALLDDLISDEDASSPTIIAKVEDTIKKALNYALHPTRRKIIWSGTPFNAKDPLYKAVESGAWAVNVFPVCEKFPCSKEEFRGSWEDRFTYESIKRQYDKELLEGNVDAFNQEMLLRIMSEEDRLVRDAEVVWYSRTDLLKSIGSFNIYITTDFATKEKEANDYSVISVWAVGQDHSKYWIDGIVSKQDMDANIRDLFNLVQRYEPLSVGIEVSGQQQGFVSWIRKEMINRKIFFNLASDKNSGLPGIQPTKDKLTRFKLVLPWFRLGQVKLPIELKDSKEMQEAYEELSLASNKGFKSKYDDWIDTLSMLYVMELYYPSDAINMAVNADGIYAIDEDDEDDDYMSSYIV